jgi:hypothetical protein
MRITTEQRARAHLSEGRLSLFAVPAPFCTADRDGRGSLRNFEADACGRLGGLSRRDEIATVAIGRPGGGAWYVTGVKKRLRPRTLAFSHARSWRHTILALAGHFLIVKL